MIQAHTWASYQQKIGHQISKWHLLCTVWGQNTCQALENWKLQDFRSGDMPLEEEIGLVSAALLAILAVTCHIWFWSFGPWNETGALLWHCSSSSESLRRVALDSEMMIFCSPKKIHEMSFDISKLDFNSWFCYTCQGRLLFRDEKSGIGAFPGLSNLMTVAGKYYGSKIEV